MECQEQREHIAKRSIYRLQIESASSFNVRAKYCDKHNNTTAKLASGLSLLNKRICFTLNVRSLDRDYRRSSRNDWQQTLVRINERIAHLSGYTLSL